MATDMVEDRNISHVIVRKKEERKLDTTEMRMLLWTRGHTILGRVRNVDIWKEVHMYHMT